MEAFNPQEAEQLGRSILRAGPICDECLGRSVARLGRGLTNRSRGRSLREVVEQEGVLSVIGPCWVCQNQFEKVPRFARESAQMAQGMEFSTYLFGVKLPIEMEQREALYAERFPSNHREPIRHAWNRALGMAFETEVQPGVTVDFKDPHLSFVIDLASDAISLKVRSIYLYGRYRKLERGIPQTRWPCRACKGRGCEACGHSGKQYPTSVEEIIASPWVRLAEAASAHLHGAGREDVDARMLGLGRPFVLELVSPRRRTFDPRDGDTLVCEEAVGRVESSPLRLVTREAVAWVKEVHATKTYRCRVAFSAPVLKEELQQALNALVGEIQQQTPKRVSHRRAQRTRVRHLHHAEGSLVHEREAVMEVEGDGGLYIKELISGDEGRTQPSLTECLEVGAWVTELDVMEVHSPELPLSLAWKEGLP